jgi:hypothetical protein
MSNDGKHPGRQMSAASELTGSLLKIFPIKKSTNARNHATRRNRAAASGACSTCRRAVDQALTDRLAPLALLPPRP